MFPARDHRLDPANAFNGDLVLVDGGTDATETLHVSLRVEPLPSVAAGREYQTPAFVQADGLDRNVKHS